MVKKGRADQQVAAEAAATEQVAMHPDPALGATDRLMIPAMQCMQHLHPDQTLGVTDRLRPEMQHLKIQKVAADDKEKKQRKRGRKRQEIE